MIASSLIAPSILAADYRFLAQEAQRVEQAGGDWLHVDIMDGHFVPNISFGPAVTAALKKSTRLPLDVHLMIQRPDQYIEAFIKAGANRITVHVEASHPIRETLKRIRQAGVCAGIALNPATESSQVEEFLEDVDLVLCMTVVPGFGGQAFKPEVLDKIHFFAHHHFRKRHEYYIEVDGGINVETATLCAQAGANVFVAGTSFFGASDPSQVIIEMRKAVKEAVSRKL